MAGGGGVSCAGSSALFLLPRTFFSKKAAAVVSADSEEQELEAIGDFFRSAILSSSTESIKEAKKISSDAGDPSKLHCEDGDGADVANVKDQLQRRRPALGRKRARFCFNPNVSDSHLNVDLKSSLDHIEDPDELFSAFENIQRAKKEWKKQMGEAAADSSPNMQWAAARKRRPGILGRKASYKHHFPEHFDTAEALSPSKTRSDANLNTFSQVSQSGTASEVETNYLSNTSDREGFIADKKKGVDKLLDTLLHCFEDLDKGEEIDFLERRLQIKSTNVDKICLPSLYGIQKNDVRKMGNKLSGEKFVGSSPIHVSPTVASGPLAAISVLRRRISEIDPLKDSFSVLSSNEKPTPGKTFPDEGSHERTFSSPLYPDLGGMEVENASGSEHPSEARSKLSHEGKLQSTVTESDMIIPSSIALGASEDFHCRTNGIADHSAGHASVIETANAFGSISFNTSPEDNARINDMPQGGISEESDHGNEELPSGTPVGGKSGASVGLFDSKGSRDISLDNDMNIASSQIENVVEDKVDDGEDAPASGRQEETDHANEELSSGTPVGGNAGASVGLFDSRGSRNISLDNDINMASSQIEKVDDGDTPASGRQEEADHGTEELPSGTPVGGNAGASAGLFDSRGSGDISLDNDMNIASSHIENVVEDKVDDGEVAPASGRLEEADHGNEELPSGTPVGGNAGASAGLFDSRGSGDIRLDNDMNIASSQIENVVEDKVDDGEVVPASGRQDETSINDAADIPTDGRSGNSSIPPEQNDMENQSDLTASVNAPVELEAPRKRQNRQGKDARKHSLSGAGMAWQSGVRRSTRIRMKPLEYWRGERLLYARIHSSLPTLVGVKYSSPAEVGQKQKQVLKVRSYVSEEYEGLVQKIALH